MLCDYVGEEKFLKGVSIYLKKRLYGSSVTSDLWEGISAATGNGFESIQHQSLVFCFFVFLVQASMLER
jgi:aminopeptidase N